MKVSNHRVGSSPSHLESTKGGKTDAANALSGDLKSGKINAGKEGVKGSAQVDVSDRAQMMQKAKDIASRPDSIDEAKVARLQKLIDEGKYQVDADAIADRLVDEHMSIPD